MSLSICTMYMYIWTHVVYKGRLNDVQIQFVLSLLPPLPEPTNPKASIFLLA